MYALVQTQRSIVFWWQQVLAHLNEKRVIYDRDLNMVDTDLYSHWLDPTLFFSQTCGYPLTAVLKHGVKVIGTPVYDSQYCNQADYCSLLIVRSADTGSSIEDFAGQRFAFNGVDSQSGFNAVKMYLAQHSLSTPFFGRNIPSGQHIGSIAMVSRGEADICAVDCVTYSLLQIHQPHLLEKVRVLDTTALTPGLPFITSRQTPDEIVSAIYDAISNVCEMPAIRREHSGLLIKGICNIPYDRYVQSINPAIPQLEKL